MIKSKQLARILFIYILIVGLFCRYIEVYLLWKLLLLGFVGLSCFDEVFRTGFIKANISLPTIFCLFLIVCSSIVSESLNYLISNVLYIIWPVLFIGSLCGLMYSHSSSIESVLQKAFVPLNIIYVINLLLILVQTSGIPLLIKGSWLAYNSFYEDLCCGLFGLNGTHEFTMFALFMNIYILSKATIGNKKSLYIYLVLTDLLLLFLSTRNDNIAMFLLLPLTIAGFIIMNIQFKTEKVRITIKKVFKIAIPFTVFLLIVINIPYINHFINEYVLVRFQVLINFNNSSYQIAGSNERLAIVYDALSHSYGWQFGKGFGVADLGGGNFFGYGSFGLSSIGSFIMIGGIWFYLAYTLVLARQVQYLIGREFKARILIVLHTVFYTCFTILYTSFVSSIWYGMFFLVLGILRCRQLKIREKIKVDI